jgi:hypothetical protein
VASGLRASGERGETQSIDILWDLSPIADLNPGTWIELKMVAEDYKPQSASSSMRRLTIISSEELDERLAARQAYILGQLREVLRMQQETRSRIKSLEIGFEVTGVVERQDVDQLQSAELNQRQVGRSLDDPSDGVAAQITAVLDELGTNRVDNPETMRRMTELLAVIKQIGQQHLPEIQRQMIHGLRMAREAARSQEEGNGSPPTSRRCAKRSHRSEANRIRSSRSWKICWATCLNGTVTGGSPERSAAFGASNRR